jgi:hypothetical protein
MPFISHNILYPLGINTERCRYLLFFCYLISNRTKIKLKNKNTMQHSASLGWCVKKYVYLSHRPSYRPHKQLALHRGTSSGISCYN